MSRCTAGILYTVYQKGRCCTVATPSVDRSVYPIDIITLYCHCCTIATLPRGLSPKIAFDRWRASESLCLPPNLRASPLKPLNPFDGLWASLKPLTPLKGIEAIEPIDSICTPGCSPRLDGLLYGVSQYLPLIALRCSAYLVTRVLRSNTTSGAPLFVIVFT